MWKILIAEDNAGERSELAESLGGVASCINVDNGEDAVRAYENSLKEGPVFDFVLLDVTMPKLDGFEVLKSIRSLEEKNDLSAGNLAKVIMITSFKDSLMENYNMGWDDFITKPVNAEILINRMNEMLEPPSGQ